MGGGNVAGYLRAAFPEITVDFVEVDPAVPEVARRYMRFTDSPAVRVHLGDARSWLAASDERWDLVVADTYIGLSVPFHLTTLEFLRTVEAHLAPGGVFALNLAAHLDAPFPRAIYRTLLAEFPTVYVFDAPGSGNRLLFATSAPALADAELAARARRLAPQAPLEPPLASLATLRLHRRLDLGATPVLTDAYAPVDRLIHLDRPDLPAAADGPAD